MEAVKPELQLICDFVNTLDREAGRDELEDAAGLGVWLRGRGFWSGGRATMTPPPRVRFARRCAS